MEENELHENDELALPEDEEMATSGSDSASSSDASSSQSAVESSSSIDQEQLEAETNNHVDAVQPEKPASPATATPESAVVVSNGPSTLDGDAGPEDDEDDDVQILDDVSVGATTGASSASAPPRRSRRKNFGNRYEEAILKEKEDGTQAPTRTRAEVLGWNRGEYLSKGKSEDWEPDADTDEDDADFRPDAARLNGLTSQSEHGSASSSSEGDSSSASGSDAEDETVSAPRDHHHHHHKSKDPLNALAEQKQSLDALLDEIARSGKLEDVKICSICLWDETDTEKDAVVQCDACGVPVHEACYGVLGQELEEAHAGEGDGQSSTETMPWFCDPCRYGERLPRCIACPNLYGAFKQTIKGDWIHSACARYIREIYFDDEERFCDAVLTELPYVRWGDRPCIICDDVYAKNAGVTINCETGMCRKYLHATCAMMVGTAAELEPEMGYPLAVYCPDHCPKEDRSSNRRCFLASLGLQRKHEMSLQALTEEERARLDAAERKQRDSYILRRRARRPESGTESSARPLHSAFWLLMKGHERADALGWDAKPVVNSNPLADNLRSSRPDFRPEFVAYVFKREKQMSECLERMEAAQETRREVLRQRGKFDPTTGRAAHKRYTLELQYEREGLAKLLTPFLPFMDDGSTAPPVGNGKKAGSARGKKKSEDRGGELEPGVARRELEPKCKICASSSFPQRMVQCDDCKERFHLKCLDPPLTTMPNKRTGVKWLCSDCAPSSEDSEEEGEAGAEGEPGGEDSGISGRKKRRLQGKNPALEQRLQSAAAEAGQPPAKRRKVSSAGKKAARKAEMTADAAGTPSAASGEPQPGVAPRTPGRKQRVEEPRTGRCCKCQQMGDGRDAVECDRCRQWFHFKTCLDPPLAKCPRTRFYGWLCEDCSSPDNKSDAEEPVVLAAAT
ncbi:LOW QUALITY PROTEIN: PHD finger protein 14-like [Paramacrobiotus metropolitanus]|uniref:LOW QUALITY PROTEIN: PHD finger protein 14-like n=1 Tax=Paramacrobiotus metropolitanus TaxID=2943436 RepID=UPI002446590E|nr:LOW QUALITY PROTEIN: PHD finger protein 14-like [Paramacrobiotus metropolitanus]